MNVTTGKQLLAAIANLDIALSDDEIRTAFDMLKERHRRAAFAVARTFKRGDKVEWDSRRAGVPMKGTVAKVNRTSVAVMVGDGPFPTKWRVHPSLLRSVA